MWPGRTLPTATPANNTGAATGDGCARKGERVEDPKGAGHGHRDGGKTHPPPPPPPPPPPQPAAAARAAAPAPSAAAATCKKAACVSNHVRSS